MNQSSTLHYRLTCDEWLQATQDLKFSEIRVLYYLRTIDPFGDRDLHLKVVDVAKATGLTKGTVSKSLKVLSDKDYIDLEIEEAIVTLKSRHFDNEVSHRKRGFPQETRFPTGNEVSQGTQEFPTGNKSFPQETKVSHRKQKFPTGNFQGPEPNQGKGSGSPHTLKTLKLDQTLSNSAEREKNIDPEFRTWLDRKASRLPEPPTFREQWIIKQAQVEANQIEFQAEQRKRNCSAASPPEQFQIEFAVEQAMRDSNRDFAIAKLQNLWADGWQDTVESLIQAHPEWRFELRDTGPIDVGA